MVALYGFAQAANALIWSVWYNVQKDLRKGV